MSTVKSKNLQVGTDATASNNFTIYQPSTPDGTLRIGVGNADSPTEVGRFTSAGYKPATAPAFNAKSTSNTTVNSSTSTKLLATDEIFDTASCYDASNSRFTPNVAGYYLITSTTVVPDTSTTYYANFAVWKNGSLSIEYYGGGGNGSSFYTNTASYLVYLNGTTDYVELYCYSSRTGGVGVRQFAGHLVQQA